MLVCVVCEQNVHYPKPLASVGQTFFPSLLHNFALRDKTARELVRHGVLPGPSYNSNNCTTNSVGHSIWHSTTKVSLRHSIMHQLHKHTSFMTCNAFSVVEFACLWRAVNSSFSYFCWRVLGLSTALLFRNATFVCLKPERLVNVRIPSSTHSPD